MVRGLQNNIQEKKELGLLGRRIERDKRKSLRCPQLECFHEITELRLKRLQPKPVLKEALVLKSDQVPQGIIQWGFQKDGEPSLLRQSVQPPDCFHGGKALPYIHFEFFNYCFNLCPLSLILQPRIPLDSLTNLLKTSSSVMAGFYYTPQVLQFSPTFPYRANSPALDNLGTPSSSQPPYPSRAQKCASRGPAP